MASDDNPLVLLIGPDKYVIQACIKHNIDAVVIYGSEAWDKGMMNLPACMRAVRVEEQSSPENVLAALHRSGLAKLNYAGVQTSDEGALTTAGLLAEHLGCRGIDPETTVHFRDKSLQKRRIAEAGIPTADFRLIEDINDVSDFAELPFERAVLKPVAGGGTMHTSVVHSVQDLRERSAEYFFTSSSQRTFMLEEFVIGDEWIADGVMFEGELLFLSLGRYGKNCLATVEQSDLLWSRRFQPDSEAWAFEIAEPLVERALHALRLQDGVFHMEIFHDPQTGFLRFGECAARRGGGLAHEQIQAKFSVSLGESALLCAIGRPPNLQIKIRPEIIGGADLAVPPGTLLKCPKNADLAARPGVEYAYIETPLGANIPSGITSTVNTIGQFLVSADSEEALERRFNEVQTWFADQSVVAPQSSVKRELRQWQRRTWPESDTGDQLWFGTWSHRAQEEGAPRPQDVGPEPHGRRTR